MANWWDKPKNWLKNVYADIQEWDAQATADIVSTKTGAAILGSINKVANYVVKPAVREALILSQDAGNLFTWSLGEVYKDTRDIFTKGPFRKRTGDSLKNFEDQFITYQRTKTGGGPLGDVGTGYLPGGEAARLAYEGTVAARPTVGTLPFTLGRAAAYPLVQLGVVSENDILHRVVSGGIDLVAAVKNPVDPFNWISPIKPGGTGTFSQAAAGRVRIDDANEFAEYFANLERRYLELQDDVVNPTGRTYTAAEQRIIDQYEKITGPIKPTLQTPYPSTSVNAGRSAPTYEAGAVYSHWKPIADDAVADISNKAGVVRDVAPSLIRSQYDRFRTSGEGQAWAQNLIDGIADGKVGVQELWRSPMFQREGLGTVIRLVDQVRAGATPDDVFGILDEAVASFDPIYSVRNVGLRGPDAVRTSSGAIIKTAAQQAGTRKFEVLPETLKIGWTDPTASARNLDDLMGVVGIKYEQRGVWLEDYFRALLGTKGDMFDFYSRFQQNVIRARLEAKLASAQKIPGLQQAAAQVLTDGVLKELTSWTGKIHDEIVAYLVDDLGASVPLPWIAGDGIAPNRLTQLLAQDYYIINPEVVDQIIDLANGLGAFQAALREVPIVGAPFVAADNVSDIIKNYLSTVWKPSRVAKPSHALRVIPEEVARGTASGIYEHPIEQMFAILGRAMRYDAQGRRLTGIPNIVTVNRDLDDVWQLLEEARGYKRSAAAGEKLSVREQELVARIPEIEAKITDLEAKLENIPLISESLIGPGRRAAIGTATGDNRQLYRVQMQRGSLQTPDRQIAGQRPQWVKGIIHELADMAANGDYRRVAAGKLLDTDKIAIGGVTDTIANHVNNGVVHPFTGQPLANDLDAVKLWLFQGDGRNIFEGYFENVANLKPQYGNGGWDNYATVADRVAYIEEDLRFVTGLDQELLDVVASNKFNGERALLRNPKTGRGESSADFREFIANEFINRQHAPLRVKFWPQTELGRFDKAAGGVGAAWDRLLRFYFEDFYGRFSDLAARSPTWRAAYWTRMEELIPFMSPPQAQNALEAAQKAGLSPTRLERIELSAARAQAGNRGTLKNADLIASRFAGKYTNDLLFNANKKSLFGAQHRILYPFFEAFREVTGTWLRLNARNPRIIRNTAQMIQTAQENNWFYTDVNGRKVLEVPFTGELARLFVGEDKSFIKNFTVGVQAINIAGQMRPGFGPVIQIAGTMLPKNANWDWLRKIISPFGEPDTENFQLQQLWVPPVLRQLLAQTQSTDRFWSDLARYAVGDVRKDDYFQRAYVRSAEFLASTGGDKYAGADGIQRLFADAERMTFRVVAARGLTAFVGPGAPITTWLANTNAGGVEVGILMDNLYRREDEAVKAGKPRYEGYNSWLNYWGEAVWPYFGSVTEANVGGLVSTGEFAQWAKSNAEILDKYPLIGGYFGPRTGERSFDAWLTLSSLGQSDVRSPEDKIAQAQDKFGNYLYYKAIGQIPPNLVSTVEANQYRADVRDQLEKELPGWRSPGADRAEFREEIRQKIDQLVVAANDPALKDAPISTAIRDYIQARDAAIEANIKRTRGKMTRTNWVDSKAGRDVRLYLALQVAPYLIAKSPEFRDVYEQVLSYEFIIDED